MCALEKAVATEDDTIIRARDTLQDLIHTISPSVDQISSAIDALETLRARLLTAQRVREKFEELTQIQAMEKAEAVEHLQRLDSEIIQAKLEAGELLTERDSIARDLGRAKRTLERLDDCVEDIRREEMLGIWNGGIGEETDQEVIDRLGKLASRDMEKMRVAEDNLVQVVEELNVVKKKRAELEEKIDVANEEW